MEAVNLSSRELNTLNYTYSNAICKIFKLSHCSVEDILHFTQEPSIKDCWMSRKTRLVQKALTVKNTVVNFVCELCTHFNVEYGNLDNVVFLICAVIVTVEHSLFFSICTFLLLFLCC